MNHMIRRTRRDADGKVIDHGTLVRQFRPGQEFVATDDTPYRVMADGSVRNLAKVRMGKKQKRKHRAAVKASRVTRPAKSDETGMPLVEIQEGGDDK